MSLPPTGGWYAVAPAGNNRRRPGVRSRMRAAIAGPVPFARRGVIPRPWDGLTADGGTPSRCGWLTDKFGVTWQIVPTRLVELQAGPDPGRVARVTQAMLTMGKLVISDLEAA